jgi:hypothetical protein
MGRQMRPVGGVFSDTTDMSVMMSAGVGGVFSNTLFPIGDVLHRSIVYSRPTRGT